MTIKTQKIIHNYDFSPTFLFVQWALLSVILIVNEVKGDTSTYYEINGKKCFYCPPGFYWESHCQVSETHAICKPCPDGLYQKNPNIAHYCGRCDRCDELVRNYEFATELQSCTSVSNTVCGCTGFHHFVPEHGGNGKGHCKENSKCDIGFGLVKKATYFNDTECEKCTSQLTYSGTNSYEPCFPCKDLCPNGTRISRPCNSKHDLECKTVNDLKEPDSEFLDTDYSSLYIGVGVVLALVAFAFVIFIIFIRRRSNSQPNTVEIVWISECIHDGIVLWDKLFGMSVSYILPDWEAFMRILMSMSNYTGRIDGVIEEAKEAYDKDLVKSRIHRALSHYDDTEMLNIFRKAVNEHTRSGLACI